MEFSQTQVWGVLLMLSFLFSSFQPLFSHPTMQETNYLAEDLPQRHGLNRKMLSLSPKMKGFYFYSPPPPSAPANRQSSPPKAFYFYSPPPPGAAADGRSSPSKAFYFYSPPPPNQP
ncbi:hypothetical protein I3843_15G067100 [Carya illinoinensis]|nr:hypothetical protein I3760_15G068700 [Carya illinoinensis]KAG7943861.1 hypothetical protein I3843_15G067100 [Carya illinoinensis]